MGEGSADGPDGRPATPPAQAPPARPPPEVSNLFDRRQAARERRDFATADAIRDQLRQAGWLVRDTPHGPQLAPAPPYRTTDPSCRIVDVPCVGPTCAEAAVPVNDISTPARTTAPSATA